MKTHRNLFHFVAVLLLACSAFGVVSLAHADTAPSCFSVIATYTNLSSGSSAQEVGEITRACARNIDGGCVSAVCERLSFSGCRDRLSAIEVAQACSGVNGGNCIVESCDKTNDCGDFIHATSIARACAGR